MASSPSAGVERSARELPLPWEPVHGDRGGLGAWLEYFGYRALTGTLAHLPYAAQDAFAADGDR